MIYLLDFTWRNLINPEFYIEWGGLWVLLFIVFAETGLMVGFFLPGDSLLFVAGMYSGSLVGSMGPHLSTGLDFLDLVILWVMVTIAGILGNSLGYWFGHKSGPYLYHRKESLLFKKRYLYQAKEFYDKHGGEAIIFARFLPIVRTFAPIIGGIVAMDRKKFLHYNVLGCVAWVFAMLFSGHYLQRFIFKRYHFDLKEHLEVIVIGIVVLTTFPVLYKIFFGRKKSAPAEDPYKNS
jgi:membrane-associated protein